MTRFFIILQENGRLSLSNIPAWGCWFGEMIVSVRGMAYEQVFS
ncbi:MAG TPA: hypothetical protein PLF05_01170 [Thermoclostridium sp.]|nr:hypothetical protein [Thermoclostridium sp.]